MRARSAVAWRPTSGAPRPPSFFFFEISRLHAPGKKAHLETREEENARTGENRGHGENPWKTVAVARLAEETRGRKLAGCL